MARRTEIVTVTAEGRDKGRCYLITEMSARQAESWAARAILALTRSGMDIPDELVGAGMAGLASLSTLGTHILKGVSWGEITPLLDEMMGCVRRVPDPARPDIVRAMVEDDIEDVGTLLWLRGHILSLHLGFSLAERMSDFRFSLSAPKNQSSEPSTSPRASRRSSRAASRR